MEPGYADGGALSFQADDGSFVLSKTDVSGTGSIDMTAMSLQALYQIYRPGVMCRRCR